MSMLSLKNLGKRKDGKWTLWDVCLEVDAGEIIGIFGRSGSGKSTLASVIAGLEEHSNGSVLLGGQASIALSTPVAAPELTVYENLDMFARLWGIPRKLRAKQVSFFIEMLGLGDMRLMKAANLSSGILKRLELARALLPDASVVVIDSLLDSLDPDVFGRVWDYLLSLRRNEEKAIVVFTSSGKIAESCQRLAVIHRGRIVFIGRPDDFRRLAGEDVVVLGDVNNPLVKDRIREQFSLVIKEEDGFLSFKVGNGERIVTELLSEYGTELSCVYLKRPTLEDALNVLAEGGISITADVGDREIL